MLNIELANERKLLKGIASLAIVSAVTNNLEPAASCLPQTSIHDGQIEVLQCDRGKDFSKLIALGCTSLPKYLFTLFFFNEDPTMLLTKVLYSTVAQFDFFLLYTENNTF